MATVKASRDLSVRIVSYNVLSSHLASPDHFTQCRPQDLEFKNRVPRVLDALDAEINAAQKTERPAVFCLQEVSNSWAGQLHAFFANRNYHMLTGLYGKKFNDYMGVALAYPTASYKTVFVDIARLSDYRVGGWPRPPVSKETGLVSTAVKRVMALSTAGFVKGVELLLQPARQLLRLTASEKPRDHWEMSENRFNILLTACLRRRDLEGDADVKGGTFVISNYHMPCAFYAPPVMNIHAEMAARRCQDLASGDPYILAGDFNLLPDSPHYELLTTGTLDRSDLTYPAPKYGMEWSSSIAGMRSAYGISNHGEPDFTNHAQIRDDEPFIGTLDYIFLSPGWEVSGVKSIPHRNDAGGPFPTEAEPSDHVLIAADLLFLDTERSAQKKNVADDGQASKRV